MGAGQVQGARPACRRAISREETKGKGKVQQDRNGKARATARKVSVRLAVPTFMLLCIVLTILHSVGHKDMKA